MKKLLLSLFAAIALQASAQPVLNSTLIPVAGELYVQTQADTVGIMPGPAGAMQNWNFNLNINGTTSITSYIDAVGTPYQSNFPMSTLAFQQDTIYTYYSTSATSMEMLGMEGPSMQSIYSDTRLLLSVPLSFGDSFTDFYEGVTTVGAVSLTVTGEVTTTYDAYGNLTINGNTINNVARVRQRDSSVQSISGFNSTTITDSYAWLDPSNPNTLLNITLGTSIPPFGAPTTFKVVSVGAEATAVENGPDATIGFLVNGLVQRGENLNVVFHQGASTRSTLAVFDAVGKLVASAPLAANSQSILISTANFAQGMYFIRVAADSASFGEAKKFVVQ